MPRELSENLQEELKELASRIARTSRLSDEKEKELLGHLEDKTTDYLSGETQMSDEDVLLLVREHFGSPEKLDSILAGKPVTRKTTLMDDMSLFSWGNANNDDFFGVFLIPWKPENRIRFVVYIIFITELFVIAGTVTFALLGLFKYWYVSLILGVAQLLPLVLAALNYLMYRVIGSKMEQRRLTIRHFAELESDCISVHGMVQSPCILQYYEGNLVFTPLVGKPLQFSLADIQDVKETRNANGKLLFGDNRYFSLRVKGMDERIGFAVARPEKWRLLFKKTVPDNKKLVLSGLAH